MEKPEDIVAQARAELVNVAVRSILRGLQEGVYPGLGVDPMQTFDASLVLASALGIMNAHQPMDRRSARQHEELLLKCMKDAERSCRRQREVETAQSDLADIPAPTQ